MKILTYILGIIFCTSVSAQDGFPFKLPKEKPNRKLSMAMKRNSSAYQAPRPEENELYSQFKYTQTTQLFGFYACSFHPQLH